MRTGSELFAITADSSMRSVLRALLERHASLGIRNIAGQCQIIKHPNFDSATFRDGPETIRSQASNFRHALILCDREGSGSAMSREEMERDLEQRLARCGWADRSAAIVIEPELDTWVWQRSPHVAEAIGWKGDIDSLYAWLTQRGHVISEDHKPSQPKLALNDALRAARTPKSADVFFRVAERVSLKGCTDTAFLKLVRTLQQWFPL